MSIYRRYSRFGEFIDPENVSKDKYDPYSLKGYVGSFPIRMNTTVLTGVMPRKLRPGYFVTEDKDGNVTIRKGNWWDCLKHKTYELVRKIIGEQRLESIVKGFSFKKRRAL